MLKKRFSIMQSKLNFDSIGVNSKKLKYYYNQKGAKCFFDYSKHEKFKIS